MTEQPDLFTETKVDAVLRCWFDGETYDEALDHDRLKTQLDRVFFLMLDRKWHTLSYLSSHSGGSEAGVSARLRDLRKPRFGSQEVLRRRRDGGLWEYKLAGKVND